MQTPCKVQSTPQRWLLIFALHCRSCTSWTLSKQRSRSVSPR